MTVQRMTEAQTRRVRHLLRRLCANYDGGNCLLLDDGEVCVCPQSITNALVCRYFKAAVLPADLELWTELIVSSRFRRCTRCGTAFVPTGGRAVYCKKCARIREKERNTDEGASPVTAGAYIVTITREADDTYAKFDQTYGSSKADAVLVIERATRDLSGITDNDIEVTETGMTYVKVKLTDDCKNRIDLADEGINFIYRVKDHSGVSEKIYYYDGNVVEDGLLYDLTPGGSNIEITGVKIKGDINYVDATCETLTKQLNTNSAPTDNWSDNAETDWYDESQTEFTITRPEQLLRLLR